MDRGAPRDFRRAQDTAQAHPPSAGQDGIRAARFVRFEQLGAALRRQLLAWARGAAPEEACGLLLGWRRGEQFAIEDVTLARNVAATERERRYVVDPWHLLAHERGASRGALRVLGAWHSHPRGPAEPSLRDLAEALPGLLYVVVDLASDGHGRA